MMSNVRKWNSWNQDTDHTKEERTTLLYRLERRNGPVTRWLESVLDVELSSKWYKVT